ncbi:MAG: hypothetical protein IPK19_01940 [Chloroflexi bacterium]|nr:hypothetical protein [Chloroflexota bacterium]
MERISAADNLVIEQDSERWRLLVDGQGSGTERLLFEATHDEPARYVSAFAVRRKLPADGALNPQRIERVVLGWSEQDGAWHLGLVLDQALAEERGSRWCGLATWRDPNGATFQEVAGHAGQSLANKLARPFAVVPPKQSILQSAQRMTTPVDTSEVRQPIPQPDLPLKFEQWTLQPVPGHGLEFALSPSWARSRFVRAGWYVILTGIFAVLTLTTLTSGIAYPRPEFLVLLGGVSIVIMILAVLVTLIGAARQPKRIIFDQTAQAVVWLRGRTVVRHIPVAMVKEIYVSHVVSKVGRWADKEVRRVRHGELNLLLDAEKGDSFVHVLTQQRTDETIPVTDDPLDEEGVTPLTVFNARTQLQSAALAIAETMRLPASYDKRL